ncbi:PepSY-associated TM helix domain-containing protein [Acinetobacter haemolyticus]|uniref:PepSY-associated TM helix domain-containing protein n=1 Tax=Acinetobacter haemolyticus TaxID=29430 RepID=UPI0021CDD7F7|nr:PepSY-associated TM helix domain-containing protein [Acinetobacter haemolyticus]MCU4378475.1 PepSY-associated TM helix domain-containing protein [Acinetobacter haemolyticus]
MYQRRDFYRHARYVHGWLSAFAFIALLFFSVTGLLLNHPEWFKPSQQEQTDTIVLPESLMETIAKQENPTQTILEYLRQQQSLVGRFQSSEILDGEVMIRLDSPAGSTDVWVLLDTAEVEITTKPATTVSLLNDLHRGKNVSAGWSWLIDISAVIIVILSLAGYILFLTLRTRLLTHLGLTAVSLALIILLIWSAV